MTGNELLSRVILSINSYTGLNNQKLEDFIVTDEDLGRGIQHLLSLLNNQNLKKFVHSLDIIRNNDKDGFLDLPYVVSGIVYNIDFSKPKFLNRNRRFVYSNTEYGYVSTSTFFDDDNLIDFSKEENELIWKQVEEYLERCYSSSDVENINYLLTIIASSDISKGLVINKTTNEFDEDKHYAFIYLSFLNEAGSLILQNNLRYSNPIIYSNLTYSPSNQYDQYFEIFDVINELNMSPDILNRFLRLYHIFEYLVYRVFLVDLVRRVGTNRIFVREFINSSEKMKKSERDSFKKNFKVIFDSDTGSIANALTPVTGGPVKNFLNDKSIVLGFDPNSIIKVADFIYGVRCCIVHNKESEYHLTLSNSEDYKIIIPLISETLKVFESLVLKKISECDNNIAYGQKTIQLY